MFGPWDSRTRQAPRGERGITMMEVIVAPIVTGLVLLALVTLCFRVALRTREPFGRLVATGIAVAFAAQSLENICMTIGLTPITGLTLPFVSFGGSSLVTSFIAVGLLASVARHRVRVVATADRAPEDPVRNLRVAEDRPSGLLARRWPV